MNKNIDLIKILKNCPKGTKFYSYIFGEETYFQGFSFYEGKPISITIYGKKEEWQTFSLSCKGHPYSDEYGECCIFPSREMRDWSKFTAPWYKEEKFSLKTLKPFERIICRNEGRWTCALFSHIYNINIGTCIGGATYKYCIPYNDETEHLIGTTENAPKCYRYWEY